MNTYIVKHTLHKMYINMYNPINVITITCSSALAPTTGLVVTVDGARVIPHVYLTAIRNINDMVHFIKKNNDFNIYVDVKNAFVILFTKSY